MQCSASKKPLKSKFSPLRDSVFVTKMIKNDRLNSNQHYDLEQNKMKSYATIAFSPMGRFLFQTEQNGPLRKVSRVTGMERYSKIKTQTIWKPTSQMNQFRNNNKRIHITKSTRSWYRRNVKQSAKMRMRGTKWAQWQGKMLIKLTKMFDIPTIHAKYGVWFLCMSSIIDGWDKSSHAISFLMTNW